MAVSLRHALTRASAPTSAPIGLQAPGSSQPSPTKIGLQAVGAHVFSAPGNVTPDTYDTAPVSVGRPSLNASLPQSPISVGRPNLIHKVSSTVESVADRGSENGFPGIGRGNAAHSVEAAASVQSQERPPSKPPLSPQSAARQVLFYMQAFVHRNRYIPPVCNPTNLRYTTCLHCCKDKVL